MARLDGKVAIVTGAGGGIGREHALLLAREGAAVVVNDIGVRAGADAASVVAEIEAAGGIASASTHSATWDGAGLIVADAVAAHGRIDIIVNNAGAGAMDDLWRFDEAAWDLTFDVACKGYFAMIRAAAPHMCRQGSGSIVNTSSGSGFGHPGSIAHATAREAAIGLTRTVAMEIGRFGVRCNAIRPFAVGNSTDHFEVAAQRWMKLMTLTMGPEPGVERAMTFDASQFPPRKIAPFVVWLCTDAARNVNGRTFEVRGDDVGLLSEPVAERIASRAGGWTLDELDAAAPAELTGDLRNPFTLDAFPDLKRFEA
ncbi:SDR family NAD(P)-dependent oxidoreductase [Sphingomonas solaris]|nr:SDR family NAD(P)-dependent oxidoreductase [Sphingomonas solaris]